MDWQILVLIGMFLASLCYLATLYHLAHGRERKAVALGAGLVMEALTRDGRIMPEGAKADEDGKPLNIGEEDYEEQDPLTLADVIVARSERAAEQIGDRLVAGMVKAAEGAK
jgi:hypothetical protein